MLLVLGAGGQVGRALVKRIGDAALGLDEKECDICDTTSVARALSATGLSAVVHLSTDYVYAGAKTASYREDDPFGPIILSAIHVPPPRGPRCPRHRQ